MTPDVGRGQRRPDVCANGDGDRGQAYVQSVTARSHTEPPTLAALGESLREHRGATRKRIDEKGEGMSTATALLLADTWGMHGDDVGTGWMVAMMLGMLVFWGAVVLGVVWLARGGLSGSGERTQTPMEILERRFAEGAMSVDEYHERRAVLRTTTHGGQGAGEAK